MAGMPRRTYDYLPRYQGANIISSLGAIVMLFGLTIIIINLVRSARLGAKAEASPWGGSTLEWQVPSPPPLENFEEIPVITKGPYEYE
jgi:cytochrome c oxidase subunit I